LSDCVVSSNTANIFKHHLDKYWFDQDVKYNYKADLHGIEYRNIVISDCVIIDFINN